jgi:hypothetical protein
MWKTFAEFYRLLLYLFKLAITAYTALVFTYYCAYVLVLLIHGINMVFHPADTILYFKMIFGSPITIKF